MAQRAEERREGPRRERAERVAVGQDRGADPARVGAEHDLADRPAGVVADDGHVAEAEGRDEVQHEPGDAGGREVGVSVHRPLVRAERERRRVAADALGREALGYWFPQAGIDEEPVHEHDGRAGAWCRAGDRGRRACPAAGRPRGSRRERGSVVMSNNIHSVCMFVESRCRQGRRCAESKGVRTIPPSHAARRTQADRSAATRDALVAAARRLFARAGLRRGVDRRDRGGGRGHPRGAVPPVRGQDGAVRRGARRGRGRHRRAAGRATWPPPGSPIRSTPCGRRCGCGWRSASSRRSAASPSSTGRRSSAGRAGGRCASGTSSGWRRRSWRSGIETGRIRPQPVRPLAHVLMGASDEAALYVAEAADRAQARAEMIEVLDHLIDGRDEWR